MFQVVGEAISRNTLINCCLSTRGIPEGGHWSLIIHTGGMGYRDRRMVRLEKISNAQEQAQHNGSMAIRQLGNAGLAILAILNLASSQDQADAIRQAVTLKASFDEAVRADYGRGELGLSTRFNHETEQNRFVFEKGFDATVFRVARNAGIVGGALEARDLLPRNGRIFFPAQRNIAYRKGGWAGSLSVWLKTDPNTMLKSRFCDPVQITERGASNGGIWFDFNDAKPRDMRMGAFPAVPAGGKPLAESDPSAPIVWLKSVGFTASEWHHVAMTWTGFDTGRSGARAALYVDGKLIGELRGREITMEWDLEKTGIYIAVGYIGLLDELVVFNRALTPTEVTLLLQRPGLLSNLTSAP
jgi:hypothetical protein